MDVILHGWMMDQALLKAAVAVLVRCEQRLLQMNEMEDCLTLLKSEAPCEFTRALLRLPCVLC
jgi:hypothetical protein